MKKEFVDFHHSTTIVQTKHAVSVKVKQAVVVGSKKCEDQNYLVWLEMDDDSQMSHLRQILLSLDAASLQKTQSIKESRPNIVPQASFTNSTGSIESKVQDSFYRKHYITHKNTSRTKQLLQSSVKSDRMTSFSNLVENSIKSNMFKNDFYYNGDVLNIITLLDTGGQPEYIHLLPTVNIHPMVTFVVHNLSNSLEDQVLVEYSEHGNHIFEPYHLHYSNFDMIKFLMSSINDSLEKASSHILRQMAIFPGKNNISYLCCVGTHVDKVNLGIIQNIDSQLTSMVTMLDCKASVWLKQDGGVLFPVDNTTAGSVNEEDPMADFIRNKIDELAQDKCIYELPITWMLFEMEIRKVCSDNDKPFMSFKDCCIVAQSTNLITNTEDVENALIYHHLLGVLLYYHDVPALCDYVIIDHQWLFDKISNIVCSSFKCTMNTHAIMRLKYNGILSKELIQQFSWKEALDKEYFIALLVEMKIIAPIQRDDGTGKDYFIPYILPTFTIQSPSDDIFFRYGCLQGESLLIQFASNLLPRGFFCCLAVEILQQLPQGWNHLITKNDTYHTYSNLITFVIQGAYYLSLLDKFSYLEVQIRHKKIKFYQQFPVHLAVQDILAKAIENVCEQLSFSHCRLQYGFHCKCENVNEPHIAVLTKLTPPFDYFAMCRYGSTNHTELKHEHIVWLTQVTVFLLIVAIKYINSIFSRLNNLIHLHTTYFPKNAHNPSMLVW